MDIKGPICEDNGSNNQLLRLLQRLINERETKVLLNMAEVTGLDHDAFGVLVAAFSQFQHVNGELKLVGLNEKISQQFRINKLNTVFDIHTEEAAAINSFE